MSSPGMDQTEELISEEIEILESIFIHELEIFEGNESFVRTIKANLRPATGEGTDVQWVCMEMWLHIPPGYPNISPVITIKNARGLSEERLQKLKIDLNREAEDMNGMQVLFQLIQHGIDFLTSGNTPDSQCSICLYNFREGDGIVKTACYHYFHEHCLSRYVRFQLDDIREKKAEARKNNSPLKESLKLLCPMCRVEIPEDIVDTDGKAPPPVEQSSDADFQLTPQLKETQQKMAELYMEQKARGGIIDIEEEKNKFFIQISDNNIAEDHGMANSAQSINPGLSASSRSIITKEASQPSKSSQRKLSPCSSDSDDGITRSNGRNRNRRGRCRMYPTPSEKKRAHLVALQKMRQSTQNRTEGAEVTSSAASAPVRQRPSNNPKKNS